MSLRLGALAQPDLSKDALRAAILDSPFADHADELVAQARRSIRVRVDDSANTGSKFGGTPRVPRAFAWPRWDARAHFEHLRRYAVSNHTKRPTPHWADRIRELDEALAGDTRRPLSFLAQLDLASMPRDAALPSLPDHGVLYFFGDMVHMPPGFFPSSRGAWQALWVADARELQEIEPPAYPVAKGADDFAAWAGNAAPPRNVACSLSWTLPTAAPTAMMRAAEEEGTDEELEEAYRELLNGVGQRAESDDHDGEHRLFGHALPVQGAMEAMCQYASNGIDLIARGQSDPRTAQLDAGVSDWILLLQLDSDRQVPWMFGDGGTMYFWIRRQDLAARDFSRVWGEMQSY